MDIHNLSVNQLKRAVAIREKIASLEDELQSIFGEASTPATRRKTKGRMSAAVRKRIAAAQKARWAKLRRKS